MSTLSLARTRMLARTHACTRTCARTDVDDPVSHGDANVRHVGGRELLNVAALDPRRPVLLQHRRRVREAQLRAELPLAAAVRDAVVVEDRRHDPALEHHPPAEVHSTKREVHSTKRVRRRHCRRAHDQQSRDDCQPHRKGGRECCYRRMVGVSVGHNSPAAGAVEDAACGDALQLEEVEVVHTQRRRPHNVFPRRFWVRLCRVTS